MTASKVIVCNYDAKGEPWPIATIEISNNGKSSMTGKAAEAYEILIIAAKHASQRMARQLLKEALK